MLHAPKRAVTPAGLAAGLLLALLAASPAAAQQSDVYVNLGVSRFDGDGGGDLTAATARAGVGFGPYFAVEGEASLGIGDDDGLELDNEIGLFAVGRLPVSPRFELLGRLGVSRIETSPGGDEDGLAYGVGAQFFFTPGDGVRGDITRHDYDVGEADMYSIAYVRRF
jgi:outer membrane immunogenic protein